MGSRKITIKKSAAVNIASIAWYIESKGMIETAERFSDALYDYFLKISDNRKSYADCKEPSRAILGYKCLPYKKKYTIIFIETETEIIICEVIASKLIHW